MGEKQLELASFAGGCFWCMVKPFDEMPGIHKIVSGYMGGRTENPTYEDVCTGKTGHYETVQITFDPETFPYNDLLDLYWAQTDPTDDGGQFFDRGPQYRTAIFYHNDQQKAQAERSKKELEKSNKFKKPIVTKIIPASTFYPAEDCHQDFYKKNPKRYAEERQESGRESFIQKNWR